MNYAAYLKHLKAILKKFDPTTAPNKETLIYYFQKMLYPSIWTQLDNRGQNLDTWDEVVEKAVNVKVKASLQPLSKTKEINSRYSKSYRPSTKKNKNNASRGHCNKTFTNDKDKAKSHNSSIVNQPQTQASKKDKRGCWESYLATEVNITKIAKKNKEKDKDLSYVKCYTCKQKDHYANKCLEKSKN